MKPEQFIERLSSVTQVGDREWIAACPAAPADEPHWLLVRPGEVGNTVLRCCSGCASGDVLAALGLPRLAVTENGFGKSEADREQSRWRAELVLFALQQEIAIVHHHAEDMKNGRPLGAAELQRLALATSRLGNALAYVRAIDLNKFTVARGEVGDAD